MSNVLFQPVFIYEFSIYIYLYFRTFIKYNIMVIYRVDYEQKRINEQITVPKHT